VRNNEIKTKTPYLPPEIIKIIGLYESSYALLSHSLTNKENRQTLLPILQYRITLEWVFIRLKYPKIYLLGTDDEYIESSAPDTLFLDITFTDDQRGDLDFIREIKIYNISNCINLTKDTVNEMVILLKKYFYFIPESGFFIRNLNFIQQINYMCGTQLWKDDKFDRLKVKTKQELIYHLKNSISFRVAFLRHAISQEYLLLIYYFCRQGIDINSVESTYHCTERRQVTRRHHGEPYEAWEEKGYYTHIYILKAFFEKDNIDLEAIGLAIMAGARFEAHWHTILHYSMKVLTEKKSEKPLQPIALRLIMAAEQQIGCPEKIFLEILGLRSHLDRVFVIWAEAKLLMITLEKRKVSKWVPQLLISWYHSNPREVIYIKECYQKISALINKGNFSSKDFEIIKAQLYFNLNYYCNNKTELVCLLNKWRSENLITVDSQLIVLLQVTPEDAKGKYTFS
jgi:hypothetical protein